MNTRFAGSNPDLHALTVNTLAQLGLGASGIYSIADLFMGDTNGLNSGEIPLNLLIGMLPTMSTLGGTLAGAHTVKPPSSLSLPEVERFERQTARRGAYGALAGAIAGGIPAVMMMRDQDVPAAQS